MPLTTRDFPVEGRSPLHSGARERVKVRILEGVGLGNEPPGRVGQVREIDAQLAANLIKRRKAVPVMDGPEPVRTTSEPVSNRRSKSRGRPRKSG